jgi:hypothetical protein
MSDAPPNTEPSPQTELPDDAETAEPKEDDEDDEDGDFLAALTRLSLQAKAIKDAKLTRYYVDFTYDEDVVEIFRGLKKLGMAEYEGLIKKWWIREDKVKVFKKRFPGYARYTLKDADKETLKGDKEKLGKA